MLLTIIELIAGFAIGYFVGRYQNRSKRVNLLKSIMELDHE